ncbi:MAG: penicillin-binding transpeptidase domain-containing protein [Planctomycetota bacterium]
MVAERRFGPVVVVLLLVLAVLMARLFQVQVVEHGVWAAEADALVRSSHVLPSHRGRLLDRHGRVLAEDEDLWKVDIVYRDFRREHPLGVVAHARSTLEMRSVPLAEALRAIGPWALEVVGLSPADLHGFATGGALGTNSLSIPKSTDPLREARASRASDLRFYVGALLRPGVQERRAIREEERAETKSERSYAEIVAGMRKVPVDDLLLELETRLSGERARLEQLAAHLPKSPSRAATSIDSLLAELEGARERFENSAADALFEEAAGFSPGRISTESLVRVFDLEWIARILRWDPARARAWAESRRAAYERDLEELVLPRVLARAGSAEASEVPERVLDGLAALYATKEDLSRGAPSWRELDDVIVHEEIPDLFDLSRRPSWTGAVLPLCDGDVREASREFDDPWLALGAIAEIAGASLEIPAKRAGETGATVRNARDWAGRFAAIAARDSRLESDAAREALLAVVRALENRHLAASEGGFEACLAAAASGDVVPGPLALAQDRIDDARQKEKFLLKDLSSRPARLVSRAEYPLVHLLERHADRFAGFEARPATRRTLRARDESGAPLLGMLLGGVRGPSLREMIASEESLERLHENEFEDEEELADIAARILRADETLGSHGLEGYFDPDLRGRNGWFETAGLDEERARGVLRAAVDGHDVQLTIDLDLQRAAEATLAHPELPDDPKTDPGWFRNPVGAIVLITPDGEVLAAASEPTRPGFEPAPGRDLERSFVRERTLTRPKFTPPGSVFKPFVAAYAIDRLGLDPESLRFDCDPLGDGGHGYGTMHCHGHHGKSDLARALTVSCNAAFAEIGEEYTPELMLDMAATFGFGAPTGIRQFEGQPGPRRPGLREDARLAGAETLPKALKETAERMRFANGLGRIEATPMQVARALAGLVSGKLPAIRVARSIGGEPVAKAAIDLPISQRAREIVCRDLAFVVTSPEGSGHNKGLDRQTLGFSLACKTGSADKRPMPAELGGSENLDRGQRRMIKQTWIGGWFPIEDPKAILVVMLHDVTETSSHTSVYVAAQFLRSEAVKRFVAGVAPTESAAVEAGAPKEDGR